MMETLASVLIGLLTNGLDRFLSKHAPRPSHFNLWLELVRFGKGKYIRVSIAYLCRIKIDGQYLLVKGSRINQYQPVGGAFKRYPGSKAQFNEWLILDDNNIPIDDKSRDDLRVRVPANKVLKLIEWFESGKHREIDIQREFQEELVNTSILPAESFRYVANSHLYTCSNFHFSDYYNCQELLYHVVYEILLSPQQEDLLRGLMKVPSNDFIWADEDLIHSLGHDRSTKKKSFAIGEHAKLLITCNNKLFRK